MGDVNLNGPTLDGPTLDRPALDGPSFARPSYEDWAARASEALRGEPASSLRVELAGGVTTEPLYVRPTGAPVEHPLAGVAPFVRGGTAASNRRGPEVRQRYWLGEPDVAGRIAADLARGLDAPVLTGDAAAHLDVLAEIARSTLGCDLARSRPASPLASGVGASHPAMLHLAPGASVDDVAALLSVAGDADVAADAVTASAGLDVPATAAARFVADQLKRWPNVRFASVACAHLGFAGAAATTELAGALAGGVSWLRALNAAGVEPARAAACVEFTVAADAHYFVNVAKLRALRWCWSNVLAACGTPEAAGLARIASTTNLSTFAAATDVELNLLRATSGAFAAAVGGADAITVEPADGAQLAGGWASSFDGTDFELGSQLARNVALVLAHEVGAHLVIDPAGGSWYAEDLTRQLAERSWQTFAAVEAGEADIDELVAADREAAAARIAAGDATMVGVNSFTFDDELRPAGEPRDPVWGTRWHEDGWFDLRAVAGVERERLAAAGVVPAGAGAST